VEEALESQTYALTYPEALGVATGMGLDDDEVLGGRLLHEHESWRSSLGSSIPVSNDSGAMVAEGDGTDHKLGGLTNRCR
jgi:hypothetical protein